MRIIEAASYLLGVLCFGLFIAKLIIHWTLDSKNGYKTLAYSYSSLIQHFFLYEKEVMDEDKSLKSRCNQVHRLLVTLFVLWIILLLSLNFTEHFLRKGRF